eukprot:COSAG05_NODE_10244_length_576_cov_0.635220_2_plen_41_part_01
MTGKITDGWRETERERSGGEGWYDHARQLLHGIHQPDEIVA